MNVWPLPEAQNDVPIAGHPGSFGAVRRHDVHTGVDLYCEPAAEVVTVEAGVLIKVEDFTGPKAGSPWWNDTKAVWVHNQEHNRTLVYGEMHVPEEWYDPDHPNCRIGKELPADCLIGYVKTVLKKDKGLPMTMLHFEMYEGVPEETVWWHHGEARPTGLLDPTQLLLEALGGR